MMIRFLSSAGQERETPKQVLEVLCASLRIVVHETTKVFVVLLSVLVVDSPGVGLCIIRGELEELQKALLRGDSTDQ